jgi:hypothetical protein
MEPTDEALLHAFYAGDQAALVQLGVRLNPALANVAIVILHVRTNSANVSEWDVDERIVRVWSYVSATVQANSGRWPHQRLTALTWLIHVLSIEMDRHLGFTPPF